MALVRTFLWGTIMTLALPTALAMAADGWGPSWSFGPTTSRIIYAKTTLVPGRYPTLGSGGPLFIWPGMSNPTSDLIQTSLNAYGGSGNSYCGATASQWCAEASVFGSFGQRNGPVVAIDADDHVTIEYKLGTDNTTWTQTVTSKKLGKVVSTLTSASGQMPKGGFGFATEAQNESFTIDTQYYLCTELRFAEADPNFAKTGVGGTGAKIGATGTASGPGTAKNIHTPDGGLTWLVDLITLPAMNPQGTQTPAPAYNCTGATTGTGGATSTGGAVSTGGSVGTGGAIRTGGATSSGGTIRLDAGTGTGGTRSDAGVASGGTTTGGSLGTGGTIRTGGTLGSGGSAVGGTTSATGGTVGSGGTLVAGSGGTPGTGGTNRTGGASTGGTLSMGGTTGSTTGGKGGATSATGGSVVTTTGDSGCGCVVGARSPRGGISAFLILGALTLLARRRRT